MDPVWNVERVKSYRLKERTRFKKGQEDAREMDVQDIEIRFSDCSW